MKTMSYGRVADTLIVLFGYQTPSADDWTGYLKFLQMLPRGRSFRVILWSRGGIPSVEQRRRLDSIVGDLLQSSRVAVLSDSSIVRGLIAAMSVVFPAYRPFSPFDIDGAWRYLALADGERKAAGGLLERLRDDLVAPTLALRDAR